MVSSIVCRRQGKLCITLKNFKYMLWLTKIIDTIMTAEIVAVLRNQRSIYTGAVMVGLEKKKEGKFSLNLMPQLPRLCTNK